jgi:hypothetical protein
MQFQEGKGLSLLTSPRLRVCQYTGDDFNLKNVLKRK